MNILYNLYRVRYGSRYNFGGDSSSSSATDTTTNTTNNTLYNDKRAVVSDNAVATTGDFNTTNKNTFQQDNSNRSTNFTDSSNRSTNFTDNSTKSSNTTTTLNTNVQTTDYGSVANALSGMGQMGKLAVGMGNDAVTSALQSLTSSQASNLKVLGDAFDIAKTSSANSQGTAMQALGMVASNSQSMADTLQSAKGATLNQKTVMMGMGALAAVLIAFAVWGKK